MVAQMNEKQLTPSAIISSDIKQNKETLDTNIPILNLLLSITDSLPSKSGILILNLVWDEFNKKSHKIFEISSRINLCNYEREEPGATRNL